MKHLQSALFALVCLGIGVGLGLGIGKAIQRYRNPAVAGPMGGDAPALRGFYFAADGPVAGMDSSPALHATAVALEIPQNMDELAAAVKRAHGKGLKVVLLPPVHFAEGDPYAEGMASVAAAAQGAKVDVLCISWLSGDPDAAKFEGEIGEVRKNFSGQVMLAATPEIVPGIEFLDKVDLIGAIIPAELPLPKRKTHDVHDFRTAWACYLDAFESISSRYGKKTVVLDTHAPVAEAGAAQEGARDEALVLETKGREGIGGVFLRYSAGMEGALQERLGTLWITAAAPATTEAEAGDDEADTDQ